MDALLLHRDTINSEVVEVIDDSVVFSSRFILVSRLAEGGTSEVCLVRDLLAGASLVAIKRINSQLLGVDSTRNIAARELSVARKLAHPCLIKMYDIHRDRDVDCIVMEYVQGDTLKHSLLRNSFTYSQIISITQSLVSVIAYLHRQGIVHSDVKPSNILISNLHHITLIDLANCRQDSDNSDPLVVIGNNDFFGYSTNYSSPEVVNDEPATTSDDVFSIAFILYEMLTGEVPVIKQSSSVSGEVIAKIKKPKKINFLQWYILKKGMASDKAHRYSSIDNFYRHFFLAGIGSRLSVIVLGVCLLVSFLIFLGWTSLSSHYEKYTIYQNAYEQQESISQVVEFVRQKPPLKRYESLFLFEKYPLDVREGALFSLYEDVVFPLIKEGRNQLFVQSVPPDFEEWVGVMNTLLKYYPRDAELKNLNKVFFQEQEILASLISSQLSTIIAEYNYTQEYAEKINLLVEESKNIGVPVEKNVAGVHDYQSRLRKAVLDNRWLKVSELYLFAKRVAPSLPSYLQVWSGIEFKTFHHIKALSTYLSMKEYSIQSFPEHSGNYFFRDMLRNQENEIDRSWYNKDILRITNKLLALQRSYRLPNEFVPLKKVKNSLERKIKKKISFHKQKKQDDLVDFLNGLLRKIIVVN
jgi:serine/threonine protein kinase